MAIPEDQAYLASRIKALEEKLLGLRASRRLLMNLLAQRERERQGMLARLEAENRRLRRTNARFAKAVLDKNLRIARLEGDLERRHSENRRSG